METITHQPRTVKDIMTQNVVLFAEETSVREMAQKLLSSHLTGAPVVNGENEVVGIVTEADIIMQRARLHIPQFIAVLDSALWLEDPENIDTALQKILGTTAKELMTTDVVTIHENDTIEDLATLFEEEHINPVPVVNDKKELVGIVSRADIVRLLAEPSVRKNSQG